MKIENIKVEIQIGKKKVEVKNLILDTYLYEYAKTLTPQFHRQAVRDLKQIFLKFDTPIVFDETTEISQTAFDVGVVGKSQNDISENKVINTYTSTDFYYDPSSIATSIDLNDYAGSKLVTIGWNWVFSVALGGFIKAMVDVSDYNLVLQENEELLITRVDVISSPESTYLGFGNNVKGLVHLSGLGMKEFKDLTAFRAYGKLHSVAVANTIGEFLDERLIGDLTFLHNNNQFEINSFFNSVATTLYPSNTLYPSDTLYPEFNYKYIVYKFIITENGLDTGEYYYQYFEIDKTGELKAIIKYERG